jgi:hypothetical protein
MGLPRYEGEVQVDPYKQLVWGTSLFKCKGWTVLIIM